MGFSPFSPEVQRALVSAAELFDDVSYPLLAAVATVESSGNPAAIGPDVQDSRGNTVNAKGLMQFMPATWAEWGEGDIFDAHDAAHAAARYLHWLMGRFKGALAPVLASYNWGIGRVERLHVTNQDALLPLLPRETQDYLMRIVDLLSDPDSGWVPSSSRRDDELDIASSFDGKGGGMALLLLAVVIAALSQR